MFDRVVTVIAGIAVGTLTMFLVQRPAENESAPQIENPTPVQNGSSQEPSEMDVVAEDVEPEPLGDVVVDNSEVDGVSLQDGLTHPPIKMPEVYRRLIGPVRPPRLYFEEQHAIFLQEPVDPVWANAMETGINNHIAIHGAGEGIVIEYVECRSSYCEVGGYKLGDDDRGFSATWGQMVRADWWQGGNEYSGKGDGNTESGRFLGIIPRYKRQR